MASPLHSKQTLTDGIHSAVSFEYASSASRLAATGFTTEDKYKLAYQISDGTIWLLSDETGPTWTLISSGSVNSDNNATFLVLAATGSLTSERVFSTSGSSGLLMSDAGPGGLLSVSVNNNIVATITGSTFTGPVSASAGLSGSLQQVGPGLSYLVAGQNVSITSQSNGQIIVGTWAADVSASYITVGVTGSLPNERSLSAGTGVSLSDGGAGSTISVGINNNVVATVSGTRFTGAVSASAGINLQSSSIVSAKNICFDREYDNGNCGGNTQIDWTLGQKQVMTLTASVTATFLSGANPPGVSNYLLRIVQGPSGGPYSILWPSSSIVKWAGAASPSLTSGSGKIDICTFYYNGNVYFGVASLNFA